MGKIKSEDVRILTLDQIKRFYLTEIETPEDIKMLNDFPEKILNYLNEGIVEHNINNRVVRLGNLISVSLISRLIHGEIIEKK